MEDDYENRFNLPEMTKIGSDVHQIEACVFKRHATLELGKDVTDLFLPKMFRTVMGLFGGEVAPQDEDDSSHSRPAPDWGHPTAPSQPKAPGQR